MNSISLICIWLFKLPISLSLHFLGKWSIPYMLSTGIYWVYYCIYQDGSVGDPSLYPSTKINNYIAIQDEKQFQECSGVHLRNFSNTVDQKTWGKRLKKERKQFQSACIIPFPSAPLREGAPHPERVSLTRKGRQDELLASQRFGSPCGGRTVVSSSSEESWDM